MNWIVKYKVYHLLFWAVYHLAWWTLYAGSISIITEDVFFGPMIFKYLAYVVFQALGVYFTLYYLLPKFLEKGLILRFIFAIIPVILLVALSIVSGYYFSAYVAGGNVYEMFYIDPKSPWTIIKRNSFPSTVSVFTLALSIKLAKNYITAQQRSQVLEKEKLETELKFLKSQFNPHFLFNTINSIFFLIDKNPVMASESLARFSGLMRYQLYECNEPAIPLNRELEYLNSFIELEEIRLDNMYNVSFSVTEEANREFIISPFLLMPFIENAFKHISHFPHKQNWIDIKLEVFSEGIKMNVSNSISKEKHNKELTDEYSGIGLQNVKRRLELLYKDKYELTIIDNEEKYSVCLVLQLVKRTIPKTELV